jgi:hypothetical protein
MTFDAFIEQAWSDHGEHPAEVAAGLERCIEDVTAPAQAQAVARLGVHVMGEHLGEWMRGVRWLDALAAHAAPFADAALERALARGRATLRLTGGDAAAACELAPDDAAAAYAGTAAALAGRADFRRALDALEHARTLASAGLPAGSPAARALAVAGNNVSAALEEKGDRDPAETAGMVAAAHTGLRYWREAGTWLEHERAEYRLASSLLCAQDAAGAAAAARRCLAVCAAHDAPAFERFFGQEVLARACFAAGDASGGVAARSTAQSAYAALSDEDRAFAEAALRALETLA